MYSPKISEELVPRLYQAARSQKIPMTRLVNRIIKDFLENFFETKGDTTSHETKQHVDRLQGAEKESINEGAPWPL